MNRPGHESVAFFLGSEIEHTPAHGMLTLFVVGIQPLETIQQHLDQHSIEHIYFGANHSFAPEWGADFVDWENMIKHFLHKNYLCTLDIPLSAVEDFNEGGLNEFNNFIPQIRVPIPYIRLWNYNTVIKIDDRDFNSTNPGVWCHDLHSLTTREKFTAWNLYRKDKTL